MSQWKTVLAGAVLLCLGAFTVQALPVRVTPVNEAEAVFAVFWDPKLALIGKYQLTKSSLQKKTV